MFFIGFFNRRRQRGDNVVPSLISGPLRSKLFWWVGIPVALVAALAGATIAEHYGLSEGAYALGSGLTGLFVAGGAAWGIRQLMRRKD